MPMTPADIALAERLADAAGDAIRPLFRNRFALDMKPDDSPVTQADRAAEAAMRSLIVAERPMDTIIGEEEPMREGTSGRSWVLDPIDGTRAFISGRPIFGTLIALIDDGWPVIGIIDQPILRERWIGVVGRPTQFNGAIAETRPCRELSHALLATTSPALFTDAQRPAFDRLDAVTRSTVLGGDCYNYGCLASGHLDIVVEAELKLHDFAALVPIVEGAGGRMCDWQGDPLNGDSDGEVIAAGDPARIDDILEAMAHVAM